MIDVIGMRVMVDDALTEYEWVKRPWRERLLTKPWRPWRSSKRVHKDVPPKYLIDESRGIIYTTQRGYLALREMTVSRARRRSGSTDGEKRP